MLRLNAVGIPRLQAWEDVKRRDVGPGVSPSELLL